MSPLTSAAEIRNEIKHLTRRQWRVAIYVILFIAGTSAVLRQVHVHALAARSESVHHVHDTR